MDDTPTPTTPTTPTTPPRSIDGMTPGSKPPTPTDTPTPTAIDVNKLDGEGLGTSPTTNDMSTTPASTPIGVTSAPEVPIAGAPAVDSSTSPTPGMTFDAKAAEAAMNDEDKTPVPSMPESSSLGGPKVASSLNPSAPKKKGKGLAIVIAVIIALALIGGASYAFWKNNQDKKATTQDTTTTTTTSVSETVTTASDGIDAELNKIDDTKEFQSTDISDTTLGL
jgi:hypothetical protein